MTFPSQSLIIFSNITKVCQTAKIHMNYSPEGDQNILFKQTYKSQERLWSMLVSLRH